MIEFRVKASPEEVHDFYQRPVQIHASPVMHAPYWCTVAPYGVKAYRDGDYVRIVHNEPGQGYLPVVTARVDGIPGTVPMVFPR